MADIVNLRRARKRRAAEEDEARAKENRARFGRTKVQKAADRARERRHQADLDGKRLDGDGNAES